MNSELFCYKDNILTINKELLSRYRSFKILLDRDKGSRNDLDARNKAQAIKEFTYIYHVVNPLSTPNVKGYNEKDTHVFATKHAGFPDTWLPDGEILAAMDDYHEHVDHIGIEPILELRKTFGVIRNLISKVRKQLDAKLKQDTLTDKDIETVMDLSNKILTLSTQIPTKITELTTAERLLKLQSGEEADIERLPGGGEIKRSMREDNEIDND